MGSSSPPKATRPPPLSTTNTSPPSLSAKSSSSALRSSPDSLNSRGGSPHSTTLSALSTAPPSSLGVSTLVAMDLSLPTVDVSFHKDDQVDLGYDGDTVSLQRTASQEGKEEGLMSDAQLQRTYLSGPSSAYTPIFDSTPSRPRPRAFTLSHSAFGSFGTFPSTARSGPLPAPTIISRIRLFFLQLFANAASAAFLVLIVVWALSSRGLNASVAYLRGEVDIRRRRPWDTDEHRAQYAREKVVKDIQYYANQCGFDVIEQTVETKDGYLLKVFKVECLKNGGGKVHSDGRRGFPVLIQHGLFQSCGSFITSEERSLAFWLAEHGDYQVYLGNNRGVFDMGHVRLKRSDPRFWDYNIKELALYDLPAMVDHVRRETGYDKIAFIGHSQGNATMFCSLAQGMVPELGLKLSLFIALAPAVYAGPLTTGFPFGALKSMKWKTWRRWFGVLDFIPLMRISYDWTPSKPFGLLGYQMFAFLFNWTDRNWLLRRKAKTFRFTPSPVSSASIFWWTGYGGFSTRGCVLDPTVERWWDARFPPLSIHHGGRDYLVLTDPLLERLEKHEKDVRVLRVQKLDEGEHCDFFWHIDAPELCFHSFLEDIEKTRPRYIDEPPLSGASSLASSRANSYTDSHGHGAVPNGNARGLEKAGAGGARRGNKGGGGLLAPEGLRQGL
ncbi:Alpha/Beta hydrolase protein [Leucosporidium creatinivorum]|uniref:Alpha/Beta hydrolase protein n=1 Tax=Leucosporidium creatinivorum TaxID=106004 RepID=A0A1Y2F5B6_9BASI|nr:Alpha/Beta hydrolase protein [Leucosporidium creatinivorum]